MTEHDRPDEGCTVGIHTSRRGVDANGSVWDRADSRQDTTQQDTDVAVAPIRLMC
jgi:hypothetical protein